MFYTARGLFVSIIVATVSFGGTAFIPAPAEAAKLSPADKVALKKATVACKAEARGKKIGTAGQDEAQLWLANRKFVKECVKEALKDHPHINVIELYLNEPNMKNLPVQQVKDPM